MIVVAGHVCLDVVPQLTTDAALAPGRLIEAGPATFASGGAVANVGIALARLGEGPVLVGSLGDDPFGAILRARLDAVPSDLSVEVSVSPGLSTSYSIVIDPPGSDRTFLHHPGCNDAFEPRQLDVDRWLDADILHFGYPPLMAGVYRDGGKALGDEFARLRAGGVTVSLDMAMPDPSGASGLVDWRSFLMTVLPHVDLFLPSWDETWYMLRPQASAPSPTHDLLSEIGDELLEMGPAVVGLKLGERGLYVRTAGEARVAMAGRAGLPGGWDGREVLSPNLEVVAHGTTGAGDATIAGFLAALRRGTTLEEAVTMASAVGAFAVEGANVEHGVLGWTETKGRVEAGWRRATSLAEDGWRVDVGSGLLFGPHDKRGTA